LSPLLHNLCHNLSNMGDGPTEIKLSRRDFLKLAGLGGAGTVLAFSEQKYGWLRGKHSEGIGSGETKEQLVGDLHEWGKLVDNLWKFDQERNGTEAQGYIKLDEWDQHAGMLVTKVFELGDLLQQAEGGGLNNVMIELQRKYKEYASYLQYTLFAAKYLQGMSIEDAYTTTNSLGEQNATQLHVGFDGLDHVMPDEFKRLSLHTEWSYPWGALARGESSGIHPIMQQIVSVDGAQLWQGPDLYGNTLLPESANNVEMDPWTLGQRPEKAKIIDFDPEVADLLSQKMKKVGIERGLKSLTWIEHGTASEGQGGSDGNLSLSFGELSLDLETYYHYQNAIDQRAFHESWHVLVGRAEMLKGIDYLRFRDIALRIAKRYDPLISLEKIFAPQGEYPDIPAGATSVEISQQLWENKNEMILTDYPVEIMLGLSYGKTLKPEFDELCLAVHSMGGGDLYTDLYHGESHVDQLIDGLEARKGELTGVAKLVAETLISNRGSVEQLKRTVLLSTMTHPAFIPEVVLPLTMVHLAMYQPERLREAMAENVNPEIATAYLESWTKRMQQFVCGKVYEDLVADVFGAMLADNGDRETNWGDTYQDFLLMLAILKKNKLAYLPTADSDVI